MAPVDTAWISAGSGLVGALVGASAALGGKWIDARHARRAEQRRQAADLLARFWEVTDRMWRLNAEADHLVQLDGAYPVGEHPDPSQPSASEEVHADWKRRAVEARQGVEEANNEAGVLLGRMRLMSLPIAEQAEALRFASSRHDYFSTAAATERTQALHAYEEAASRLMTS